MISVIIPVYDIEDYIGACVRTVLDQTRTDLEILLVDDGSRDRSGQICDEMAEEDPRIRVFHTANRGQAAARNLGLDQALGEWISFVDGDDLLHPRMLEILVLLAEKNGVCAARCYYKHVGPDAQKLSGESYTEKETETARLYGAEEYYRKALDGEMDFTIWGTVYRRECLKDCRFTEGMKYEDVPYIVKILHNTGPIMYTSLPLYGYRQREGSTVKTITVRNLKDMIRGYELQMAYTADFFPDLVPLSKAAMWSDVMNHCIKAYSLKGQDRKEYLDTIRDFRKSHRFARGELKNPGILLRRRVILALAGPFFFPALGLKKMLAR